MLKSLRRLSLGAAVTVTAGLAVTSVASAASYPLTNWKLSGTVGLAKLQQPVTLPAGSTFNGSIDSDLVTFSGDVSIPTIKTTVTVAGIPMNVTLQYVEATPVSGAVTLGWQGSVLNASVDASLSMTIKVLSLSSGPLPINLVGNGCQTSAPMVMPLSDTGPFPLAELQFTGTTTIPPLTNCGLVTPALNAVMAGAGNPYSVTIAP